MDPHGSVFIFRLGELECQIYHIQNVMMMSLRGIYVLDVNSLVVDVLPQIKLKAMFNIKNT